MQTRLKESLLATEEGQLADSILRKCVHCGFCNATCPTYQELGDEVDGPRGRIYMIKEMLEGKPVTVLTAKHLDRCLLCRACETTCPSGVEFSRLMDIAQSSGIQSHRSWWLKLKRELIKAIFPYPLRLRKALTVINLFRLILPSALQQKIPKIQPNQPWPVANHKRTVLLLEGCVQSVAESNINVATAKLLDSIGLAVKRISTVQCCGALHYHLNAKQHASHIARHNIDHWWPEVEAGAEAIVSNASGCGVMIKDYPYLLHDDPDYQDKAKHIAQMTQDVVQVLECHQLSIFDHSDCVVVFHSPCTLQHGLKLGDRVEKLLRQVGVHVSVPANPHLCCGSAGSYSILQPELSQRLLENKISAINACQPNIILTSNIGCLLHLKTSSTKQVLHWVEYLANLMDNDGQFGCETSQ